MITLSTSNWNHGVNRLNSGLYRSIYCLTVNNTVGNSLYRTIFICINWSFFVNRLS